MLGSLILAGYGCVMSIHFYGLLLAVLGSLISASYGCVMSIHFYGLLLAAPCFRLTIDVIHSIGSTLWAQYWLCYVFVWFPLAVLCVPLAPIVCAMFFPVLSVCAMCSPGFHCPCYMFPGLPLAVLSVPLAPIGVPVFPGLPLVVLA